MYRKDRSSSATTELADEVTAEIWGYFQGERRHQVDPPDRGIVRRCVEALHGHSIQELRVFLRDRFRQGFRPGTARGPREYTWFPPVIDNAFRPHK